MSQGGIVRGWRGAFENVWLLVAMLVCFVSAYGFIEIWDEVRDGDTQSFDVWMLQAFRRDDDPRIPVGPEWLREAAMDATALGSNFVIATLLCVVSGLLFVDKFRPTVKLIIIATIGGALFTWVLKGWIARDRPDVVPHLRDVASASFPSGHAALSATVFLTIGILLAESMPGHRLRVYCLVWSVVLTLVVGFSRVYLGVHYPTDVLAGWMFGASWALACWIWSRWMRGRRLMQVLNASDEPV